MSRMNRYYVSRTRKRKKKRRGIMPNLGTPLQRSYRKRKESLTAIGFKSYPAYLRSDLWLKIKLSVLEESPECIRCKREATEVHHANYSVKTLLGEDLSRLFPICRDCHHKAEFDKQGRKTTVGRANRFLGLDASNGRPVKFRAS